jgi:eukaryotic-like serine/threonine-protein kinase
VLCLGWLLIRSPPLDRGLVLTRLTFDAGLTTNPVVSPDGKLLAYANDRDGKGNLDVWVRQLAGGEPMQVTRDPADESEPDFSPDGTKLVYRSNREGGGVYTTSTLGVTEPQMVAAGGHTPRFSPDGKWITYYTGETARLNGRPMRSKLFILDVATEQTRQIEPQLAAAYHAIWSPDSKHILFAGSDVAHVYAPVDWYVATLDDRKAIRTDAVDVFSRQGLSDVVPHLWAADGNVIFSAQVGDSRNIWQLAISGRGWRAKPPAKRVTFGTGIESDASLASVATSKHLVFSVLSFRTNLWALPLAESGADAAGQLTPITDDEAVVGFPDLAADGNLLVFPSNRSGSSQIWSKDFKTGREVARTSGMADVAPTLAPDGSRFAYYAGEEKAKFIVTIAGPTANPRSRRKIAEGDGWTYGWSPDGSWLFFAVKAERWGVEAIHVSSGRRYVVFQQPDYDLTFFRPSPDNHWGVASTFEDSASRILIAPFREATTIREVTGFRLRMMLRSTMVPCGPATECWSTTPRSETGSAASGHSFWTKIRDVYRGHPRRCSIPTPPEPRCEMPARTVQDRCRS